MAASTAVACVLSFGPTVVTPDGGFFDLPRANAQCCSAAQTPVQILHGPEWPVAEGRPGAGTDRADDAAWAKRGQRNFPDTNQRASYFTTDHPALSLGDRRTLDRGETRTGMPGSSVAEVTAGDGLVVASVDLGETAGQFTPPPAVTFEQLPSGRKADRSFALADAQKPPSGSASSGESAPSGIEVTKSAEGTKANDTTQAAVDQSAPANATGIETGEFSGSATPAGPDLTKSEEEKAIAQGWK